MPRGVWKDPGKRSAAAKKAAAHRKSKPRGPYGVRVLTEADSAKLRAIAAKIGAARASGDAAPLANPGELGARIDAVLGALDARDRGR